VRAYLAVTDPDDFSVVNLQQPVIDAVEPDA
jgi:hypothetical protein